MEADRLLSFSAGIASPEGVRERTAVTWLSWPRDTRLRNVPAGDSPVMTDLSSELGVRRNGQLRKAVYQNRALSRAGFSERLFALLFTGLVYPQIWEDPEVDIEAMELLEGHRVVTIASGGCNVLAYLTRSPAHIDAVDLNTAAYRAQQALKLAAVKHPAGAEPTFPLFRRGRHPDQFSRLRSLPGTASRRPDPQILGKAQLARTPAHHDLRSQLLPHRPARPVHRRTDIEPPSSMASTRPAY